MAAATGMPMAPSMMDATAGNAMMQQGVASSAGALAELYKNNRTTGTTESRANTHQYNLDNTMGTTSGGTSYS
jgi:hypothetical protein